MNLGSVRLGSTMSLQRLNIGFAKLTSKWAQGSHSTLSRLIGIDPRPCLNRAKSLNLLPLQCSTGPSELHSHEYDPRIQVSSFTSPRISFTSPRYESTRTECDSWIPTCGTGFTLLPIRCSFPAKLHPQYEMVRIMCDPWILNLAPPGSEQLLIDNLIPRYVCRLFLEATNLPDVEIATKFIAWLTLADDIVDNGPLLPRTEDYCTMGSHDHGPPSTTNVWAQSVLSKLRDTQCPNMVILFDNSSDCHAQSLIMLDALGELWGKMSS